MSFKDLQILCQAFEFDHNKPANERSFLNASCSRTAISEKFDLMKYVIDYDELNFGSSDYEEKDGLMHLYYEASDFNVVVSGIDDNDLLRDYFFIYDTTGRFQFIKYKVQLIYCGVQVLEGTINQESISEPFLPSGQNNEAIKFQIVSLEKEFKEYFDGMGVQHPQAFIDSGSFFYNLPYCTSSHHNEMAKMGRVCYLFDTMFASSELIVDINDLTFFSFAALLAQLFKVNQENPPFWSNSWFIKTGVLNFFQVGMSRFKLLQSICNSMGWVWYLVNHGGKPMLVVKDRVDFSNEVIEVDFENFKNWEVGNIGQMGFKHVIIPDGELVGNSNAFHQGMGWGIEAGKLMGERFAMVSNTDYVNNKSNHFESIYKGINVYTLNWGENQKVCVKDGEGDVFKYREYYYTMEGHAVFHTAYHSVNSKDVLFLDGGNCSGWRTFVVLDTAQNFDEQLTSNNSQTKLIYSGNAGNMILKIPENYGQSNTFNIEQSYQDYVMTQRFKDNFKCFIKDPAINKTVKGEIYGVMTDPRKVIKFINTDNPFFSQKLFAVTQMSVNFDEEITNITLTRQE